MVNSAPGFDRQPTVIDGASDLFIEIWGPELGRHARSAVGMAELPRGYPVEIEAVFLLRTGALGDDDRHDLDADEELGLI